MNARTAYMRGGGPRGGVDVFISRCLYFLQSAETQCYITENEIMAKTKHGEDASSHKVQGRKRKKRKKAETEKPIFDVPDLGPIVPGSPFFPKPKRS